MTDNNQSLWPGWETVRLIGRGSFGSVYEIQQQVFSATEKAALKKISIPQNRSDIDDMYSNGYDDTSVTEALQSHLESIVAEYSMMRKMKGCANIVSCDDIRYEKQANGIGWDIYIKMELLTPIVKALPADTGDDTVIKLAQDMCAALELCRKYGIVHRDIKPQNIFLSAHGDYKLGDFGIAKTVEKTMGGTKIGTYKYMAPEVYNNQPYGAAVDIYSLGLVMYWLLNKRRMPFMPLPPAKLTMGMDEASRQRRFSGEPLPPPATGSDALKRIVLKACAFDPKERYGTAAEMLADLNSIADIPVPIPAAEPPITTPPDTEPPKNEPPKTTSEKNRSKKSPILLGLAAGLIALIVIILLLLRGCENQKPVGTEPYGTTEPVSTTADTNTAPPETTVRYELVLNTDRLSVFEGTTAILEVSGIPGDAQVKWSSSDKSVAKVDSDGEVTGISEGVAVITAEWKHNGETYTASAEVTVTASGVTLDNYTIHDFYIGQTRTLTATTSPAGGQVTWESSNTSVATVSADGVVTAVSAGNATITAVFGEYKETCAVTVTSPSVTLNMTSISLYVGETETITAAVLPPEGTVTWTSSSTSVATVSSDGVVTAVGNGTAEITASCGNISATCLVTVKNPSISLNQTSLSLMLGDSATVSASVEPAGATVSWSSDNTQIVTVNGGKIQAVGNGTTKVWAKVTYGGKTCEASCSVTVNSPGISLYESSVTISQGESVDLHANVTPSGTKVSWSSSNTSVATVNNGTVRAVGSGTATITAQISYAGKTYKATCTVTVVAPQITVTSSASTITYAERKQDRGTCTLTAKVTPDGGSIAWSSSNSSVAQVSGNGTTATVTAISSGTATITATYTIGGHTVRDQCTITVKQAASTLNIKDFSYKQAGTVNSFSVSGTIYSNYALDRVEISGYAVAKAINWDYPLDDAAPYTFSAGTYEASCSVLTSYFINQFKSLYNVYSTFANLFGASDAVEVHITVTVYDTSGNYDTRNLIYTITGN